jgi:hypothetical protein
VLSDPANYQTFAGFIMLSSFAVFSYWIELLAATNVSRYLIFILVCINLTALLIYPIFVSFAVESLPLSASYLMISATALTLKLYSFHHVMHDNRKLLRRLKAEGNIDPNVNKSGLPNDVYALALQYPNNLNIAHFIRYFLAPTCCYQLAYPSSKRIRWSFITKRFMEIVLCTFLIVYLVY